MTKTHKASGWKRTAEGFGVYRIDPTDDSGVRRVKFLSPMTWQNDPGDDRANIGKARVILVSGDPLPEWAQAWLHGVNERQCEESRRALRAAIDDADFHADSRYGW